MEHQTTNESRATHEENLRASADRLIAIVESEDYVVLAHRIVGGECEGFGAFQAFAMPVENSGRANHNAETLGRHSRQK